MGGGAGHEGVVLVAAGDVHVDLAVGLGGDFLVEAGVVAGEPAGAVPVSCGKRIQLTNAVFSRLLARNELYKSYVIKLANRFWRGFFLRRDFFPKKIKS